MLIYGSEGSHSGTLMYCSEGSHSGTLIYGSERNHSGTLMYCSGGQDLCFTFGVIPTGGVNLLL